MCVYIVSMLAKSGGNIFKPYVCVRAWTHATWLIHVCDVTYASVWRDSFIRVMWLIRLCAVTRSYICDMTHSCVWHYVFICVMCARISRSWWCTHSSNSHTHTRARLRTRAHTHTHTLLARTATLILPTYKHTHTLSLFLCLTLFHTHLQLVLTHRFFQLQNFELQIACQVLAAILGGGKFV